MVWKKNGISTQSKSTVNIQYSSEACVTIDLNKHWSRIENKKIISVFGNPRFPLLNKFLNKQEQDYKTTKQNKKLQRARTRCLITISHRNADPEASVRTSTILATNVLQASIIGLVSVKDILHSVGWDLLQVNVSRTPSRAVRNTSKAYRAALDEENRKKALSKQAKQASDLQRKRKQVLTYRILSSKVKTSNSTYKSSQDI